MTVSRPLTKETLKKLMLKAYGQAQPQPIQGNRSYPIDHAIAWAAKHLGINALTNEEQVAAYRAAFELERDGFLWQDIKQSDTYKILTDLGRRYLRDDHEKMVLPSIDIDQLLSRDDLRSRVRDDFNSGDYETAVFKAFKFLEESVRAKAGEPASSLGVALMSAAFSPTSGKLKHPGAAVPQEQDGLHQLMRGAIAWYKNPSSHRTVIRDDARETAQVLAFANLLLDVVNQC